MALPKRRQSSAKQAKRRTHWKLEEPNLSKCTQCGRRKMPHKACPHCGYYKGRQVVQVKEKKKKEK